MFQHYYFQLLRITQPAIMELSNEQMLASFRMLDSKFRKSCHHIRMLNRRIEEIQVRYDRAFSSGRRSFRYTHRLKLATYEGMRNMYYEYACLRADELEHMQAVLIQRGVISDSESEEDEAMDCWCPTKMALFRATLVAKDENPFLLSAWMFSLYNWQTHTCTQNFEYIW